MHDSRNNTQKTNSAMAANQKLLSLLFLSLLITLHQASQTADSLSPRGIKAAYWPSWQAASLPPSTIPTPYFTHVFYAFLLIDATTFKVLVNDNDVRWMAAFTSSLHSTTPSAKALLSIGGAGADPATFSAMATAPVARSAFIISAIAAARIHGFDGLDLDWEFPADANDMSNLALLLEEWRVAVNRESVESGKPRLLLSAAVYYSAAMAYPVPRTYPGDSFRKSLNFVSPMCFDYHGGWEPNATAAHALLYDSRSNLSTSYGVAQWKRSGVGPGQIVMGMPVYGRTWQLKDPNQHGIGAPAVGAGQGGGVLVYSAVVGFNAANNEQWCLIIRPYLRIRILGQTGSGTMMSLRFSTRLSSLGLRGLVAISSGRLVTTATGPLLKQLLWHGTVGIDDDPLIFLNLLY